MTDLLKIREPEPEPEPEPQLGRPRRISDYAEPALSVTETTIALRKEELLRLLISGKRTRDVAQIMCLGVGTVRTYMRCPEFQQKLWDTDQKLWQRIDEELRVSKLNTVLRIQELSEAALEHIAELMESDDEGIVYRASADILDRNPDTSKHSKNDNTTLQVNVSPEQLMLAAKVAQEMEVRRVNTVDATNTTS